VTAPDPAKPSGTTESQTSVDGGGVPGPIVVKVHEMHNGGTALHFADGAANISVIAAGTDQPPADLVLWTPTSIEGQSLHAIINQYHPIPVFVVLDASKQPAHISRCLQAGAIQCLIDPPHPVLIAHIHATVRRLRARQ
jgi:CheY-like chemotaxis protein